MQQSKALYISRIISLVDKIERVSVAYLKFVIKLLRKKLLFSHFHFMRLVSADATVLIAILHRDLKECLFVLSAHLLSISYLDFYFFLGHLFLFSIWTFTSLFY